AGKQGSCNASGQHPPSPVWSGAQRREKVNLLDREEPSRGTERETPLPTCGGDLPGSARTPVALSGQQRRGPKSLSERRKTPNAARGRSRRRLLTPVARLSAPDDPTHLKGNSFPPNGHVQQVGRLQGLQELGERSCRPRLPQRLAGPGFVSIRF